MPKTLESLKKGLISVAYGDKYVWYALLLIPALAILVIGCGGGGGGGGGGS